MKHGGIWSVLKERDFRLIWTASVCSDLGTWMQISALAIFVTSSTGQSRWTGVASTITYLTAGLFTPLGGVLADRFDRRRLTIVASLLELVTGMALVACFASGVTSPLALISIAGLQGILGSVVMPALNAMAPDLVTKERSAHAALLESLSWNLGRAFGPIIAVAVVNLRSYSTVFLLNAFSFGAVALALAMIHARPRQPREGGKVTQRLADGWRELRRNTLCFWPTVIATVEIAFIASFVALIPAMAQLTLHTSSTGSGILFFGQGAGSALGVVAIGSLMHRFGLGRTFIWMMVILPPLLITYALSPSLVFATIVIIPLSGAHAIVIALAVSFVQRFSADAVRARVLGLHKAITITSYAIVSSILGVIASWIGLRITFVLIALLTAAFVGWLAIARRSALDAIANIDDREPVAGVPYVDDELELG